MYHPHHPTHRFIYKPMSTTMDDHPVSSIELELQNNDYDSTLSSHMGSNKQIFTPNKKLRRQGQHFKNTIF